MRGYVAFTKKEVLENVRIFKMLILFFIFFIFGMMSPLMAKLMPEILSQMPIEGVTIILSEPTASDSYMQFFKNITQMGMIILILVFSGTLTQELNRGTLINIPRMAMAIWNLLISRAIICSNNEQYSIRWAFINGPSNRNSIYFKFISTVTTI